MEACKAVSLRILREQLPRFETQSNSGKTPNTIDWLAANDVVKLAYQSGFIEEPIFVVGVWIIRQFFQRLLGEPVLDVCGYRGCCLLQLSCKRWQIHELGV